jgi:hypothetical protein
MLKVGFFVLVLLAFIAHQAMQGHNLLGQLQVLQQSLLQAVAATATCELLILHVQAPCR